MRLTVGPLPAAVYWRRRGVVLVGFAMVVLVISYAFGGSGGSTAGAGTNPTLSVSPAATATVQRPIVPTSSPTPPTQTPFTLPVSGVPGACADAEMDVTATAGVPQVQRGQAVEVTIKIKNTSDRTCSRDVGADMQELSLTDGQTAVWSSDDCTPRKGSDVRSFGPAKEFSFTLTWSGKRSRTGTGAVNCDAAAPAPDAAVYQLVARLDKKLSPPFALRIEN